MCSVVRYTFLTLNFSDVPEAVLEALILNLGIQDDEDSDDFYGDGDDFSAEDDYYEDFYDEDEWDTDEEDDDDDYESAPDLV
jgi:hypothetical protein